jgi:hypothetical protein
MKIPIKTPSGQEAFKARSALLSARQRSMFLICDGVKTVEQVLAATSGLGITSSDLDYLCHQGFLEVTVGVDFASTVAVPLHSEVAVLSQALPGASVSVLSGRTAQERFGQAMPLATQVTASLGLRGFRLNLAVSGATTLDDLLLLFPKIQAAAGSAACADLERVLKA